MTPDGKTLNLEVLRLSHDPHLDPIVIGQQDDPDEVIERRKDIDNILQLLSNPLQCVLEPVTDQRQGPRSTLMRNVWPGPTPW